MGFIYDLKDPVTNHIRYIGKSNNPKNRFYRHIKESKDFNNKTHKANWIRILLKQGLKPEIILIDEVPKEQINFWEIHYIKLYKKYEGSFGYDLTNTTEGGDGGSIKGHKKSESTKKKMSEYWTKFRNENKQTISEEQKTKISNSLKMAYKNGIKNHII
jgi:hypothetical protein